LPSALSGLFRRSGQTGCRGCTGYTGCGVLRWNTEWES